MRVIGLAALVAGITAVAGCSSQRSPEEPPRVIDLGHALSVSDPTWSGGPAFGRTGLAEFDKAGYEAGHIDADEHFGTHVDAPSHFAKGGATVDQIPVDRLVRPAVCIDVRAQARANEDYRIVPADITAFEAVHGRIAPDTVVLFATGWDARWPDAVRYMNNREGQKHFPGLSVEAATLLATERRVAGIGIDTPSIDYGPSTAFEAHRITQAQGVYHVENAARLSTLPPTGFTVVVAPIKIAGGSGGPTRVFALVPASAER